MTPKKEKPVLVVEDDEDLLDLIASVLTDDGYTVLTAADGQEALDAVTGRMPSLILLDVRMPGVSGPEFLARFREAYDHAAPVILLTGAESGRDLAKETDADGYLSKPFDLDELLRCVAVYLSEEPGMEVGPCSGEDPLESHTTPG